MIAAGLPSGGLVAGPLVRTSPFADRWFLVALIAPATWAGLALGAPELRGVAAQPLGALQFVVLFPLLEEIVFRGGLQPTLARSLLRRWGPLSAANIVTSAVFAALHLGAHPPLWAAAVFLPSLLFGVFRERAGSLWAPTALHAAYNFGYLVWAMPN